MKYTSDDNVARYKPLVGVNKKFVEYLYRYFNIMDTIYPLT
jgi:NH3-dependent NAD+ synthetase